jgi:hypothetical protein
MRRRLDDGMKYGCFLGVQSLAKSASPLSLKKILSTGHIGHFWHRAPYVVVILCSLCIILYYTCDETPKIDMLGPDRLIIVLLNIVDRLLYILRRRLISTFLLPTRVSRVL